MGNNKKTKEIILDPVKLTEKFILANGQHIELFDFQKQMLKHFDINRFSIVIKSRQMFTDTLMACYCVMNAICFPKQKILYIATNSHNAEQFIEMVNQYKSIYKNKFIGKKFEEEENKYKVCFKNESYIKAHSPGIDVGRGELVDMVIFSEMAYMEYAEEIYTSILMAIDASTSSKIIAYSCPNYENDIFHTLCEASKKGENKFNLLTIPWILNPLYIEGLSIKKEGDKITFTSPWYEDIKKLTGNEEIFNAEYNLHFKKRKKHEIVTFRLEEDINKKLTETASKLGINISEYIRKIIIKELGYE